MPCRSLRFLIPILYLLSSANISAGQTADSVAYAPGSRAYWKHMKAEQKARYHDFTEWQKDFLNIPSGRFSMMLSAGYGLPVINQRVESIYPFLGTSILTVKPDGSITEEGIYTTDGKGWRANFRGRYMFNPFAGMELGIAAEWYNEIPNGIIRTPTFKSSITSRSYALTVAPQLVLTSPNLRNFYIYGRIGLYLPVWGGSWSEVHVEDRQGALIRELLDADLKVLADFAGLLINYEEILGVLGYRATLDAGVKVDFYKNPTVIGFQTAVGFRYQITREWSAVFEYFHGGYAPYLKVSEVRDLKVSVELFGREIVALDENGGSISLLPGSSVPISPDILSSTLNVNYYRSLDQDANNAALNPDGFDPTLPADELTDKRLAYSNGFFIGIQYNLPSREDRGRSSNRRR